MTDLAARAADLLREPVAAAEPLSGGDLSQVLRLRLASGRAAVAKLADGAEAEAEMLRAIRAAGVPAPAVLAAAPGLLLLEALDDAGGPSGAWADLGRVVRRLHAAAGPGYGWPVDHAFGAVPIPNAAAADWPSFWAERRLMAWPDALPVDLARRLERVARALPERLPARPAPSLLHGDLWTGNVLAARGRVTGLIDPAAYHGHAEVDLAMLALFAAPGPAFQRAYGATEPGLGERRPLYQLWPALVHLRLFGPSWRGLAERLLRAVE